MPTGTSRSHTSKIEPERLAERDWFSKSQSPLLNIYFRLSGFYVSTSASVWILVHTTQKCVARNPSGMWRSTFEIGCPVAEIAPKWRAHAWTQTPYAVEGEHSLSQFQALLFPTPHHRRRYHEGDGGENVSWHSDFAFFETSARLFYSRSLCRISNFRSSIHLFKVLHCERLAPKAALFASYLIFSLTLKTFANLANVFGYFLFSSRISSPFSSQGKILLLVKIVHTRHTITRLIDTDAHP